MSLYDDDFQRELEAELRAQPAYTYPRTPQDRTNEHVQSPHARVPKNAQTLRLYLKKYGFIVKLLCLVDFALALFRCFTPHAFWLGAGVVFAPLGFVGALRFRRRYVLAFAVYGAAQVLATLVFTLLYVHSRTQTALFMLAAGGEALVAYHVFHFFRVIPVDEVIRA